MPSRSKMSAPPLLLATAWAFAGPARAADKFKVTGVECEVFWLMRHTPVLHYDVVDERRIPRRRVYHAVPDPQGGGHLAE